MAHLLTSEKLGERLFEARQAAGLGMRKLSQLAHVGEATINDIEKGRHGASTDTVERLAIALGVRPAWLAYGDGVREATDSEAAVLPQGKHFFSSKKVGG